MTLRKIKTRWVVAAGVAGFMVLGGASGCEEVTQDRQSGAGLKADNISDTTDVTVWRNIDGAPNVVTFCADGLAFAGTLSMDGARSPSILRLPELDQRCGR